MVENVPGTPWEAALGTSVQVPTPAGAVNLKVRPGSSSGQKLRLAGRGLPMPRGGSGDLFAVTQIVMPEVGERERALYEELSRASSFNPRRHFDGEGT